MFTQGEGTRAAVTEGGAKGQADRSRVMARARKKGLLKADAQTEVRGEPVVCALGRILIAKIEMNPHCCVQHS